MAAVFDDFRVDYAPRPANKEYASPNRTLSLTENDLARIKSAIGGSGWKSTVTITLGILGAYTGVLIWGLNEYGKFQHERLAAYERSQGEWFAAYKTSMGEVTRDLKELRQENALQFTGLTSRIDRIGQTFMQDIHNPLHDHQSINDDLDAAKAPRQVDDQR